MYVSIAGLIGSGKSTLVNNLVSNNNYYGFNEPVDNNPFLSKYYNDPKRWAYTLQTFYLWERYKQSTEAFIRSMNGETVVMDSSLYSDMAFAIVQYRLGYFNKDEYNTYNTMHKIITAKTPYPDVFVWLSLPVDETLNRIKQRSRECESGISVDYLISLNEAYDEVLNKLCKHTDIIRINARQSASMVYEDVSNVIEQYKAHSLNGLVYM